MRVSERHASRAVAEERCARHDFQLIQTGRELIEYARGLDGQFNCSQTRLAQMTVARPALADSSPAETRQRADHGDYCRQHSLPVSAVYATVSDSRGRA